MRATGFILAAGFGTRLRPLTLHRPKPLVPVCGVPTLAYSLALCRRHGIEDLIVNAHYLADQINEWAGEHDGLTIRISHETPDILGTGGGLALARPLVGSHVVVLAGDVLTDVNLTDLMADIPARSGVLALRRHREDAARYGCVSVDTTGTVVQIRTFVAPDTGNSRTDDTHFTGVHALDSAAIPSPIIGFGCIVSELYMKEAPKGRVKATIHDGTWFDIGNPAAYLAANLAVLRGQLPLALDPHADVSAHQRAWSRSSGPPITRPGGLTIRGGAWIGVDAMIGDDCLVEDSIIGPSAQLPSGTHLTRCVVWDGAVIPAGDHTDTIFHDGGSLMIDP